MASARQPNGTAVTLPVPFSPNGYQVGDLLIAFVYIGYDTGFSTALQPVAPAGWLLLDTNTILHASIAGGDAGDRVACYYRLSTGVEPASYTWTWNNPGFFVGRIVVYRNVDQANPLESLSGFVISSGLSATPTVALGVQFTVLEPSLLVCAWMALADLGYFSMPITMMRRTQNVIVDDPSFLIIGDYGINDAVNIYTTIGIADEFVTTLGLDQRDGQTVTTSQQADGDRFVWGIAILVKPAS